MGRRWFQPYWALGPRLPRGGEEISLGHLLPYYFQTNSDGLGVRRRSGVQVRVGLELVLAKCDKIGRFLAMLFELRVELRVLGVLNLEWSHQDSFPLFLSSLQSCWG